MKPAPNHADTSSRNENENAGSPAPKVDDEKKLAALNIQMETLKLKHTKEMETLKSQHEENISQMETEHKTRVSDNTAEYEKQIKDISAKHDKQIQEITDKYDAKIKGITGKHEIQIASLKETYTEKLTLHREKTQEMEHEVKELTDKISKLETEITAAQKESRQLQAQQESDFLAINSLLKMSSPKTADILSILRPTDGLRDISNRALDCFIKLLTTEQDYSVFNMCRLILTLHVTELNQDHSDRKLKLTDAILERFMQEIAHETAIGKGGPNSAVITDQPLEAIIQYAFTGSAADITTPKRTWGGNPGTETLASLKRTLNQVFAEEKTTQILSTLEDHFKHYARIESESDASKHHATGIFEPRTSDQAANGTPKEMIKTILHKAITSQDDNAQTKTAGNQRTSVAASPDSIWTTNPANPSASNAAAPDDTTIKKSTKSCKIL